MFRLDLIELVGDVPGLPAEELQRLPGPLNVSFRHEEDDDDGDDGGDDGDDGDDGGGDGDDHGDDGNDRVYRGVEARPHSWPWVAKIKTIFTHPGGR